MQNVYLVVILVLIALDYAQGMLVEILNLRHVSSKIPETFQGWYDPEKYDQSQRYLRDTTRFDMVEATILTPVTLAFLLLGGFAWVDGIARNTGCGMIATGLIFAALLGALSYVIHLPFNIYSTFVLEERYGFNKTTPKTFVGDQVKGIVLSAVLGGLLFAAILWFFSRAGTWAWLYSWIAVTVFQLLMVYIAPITILPLFNKFTPLEEGELREAIQGYADQQGFALQGIYTMDGSKRSTKSNAYFTGFGRWRRIVLFDTLIEKHDVKELVAVLAHEVGHFKLRHIHKHLVESILSMGLMFFILSLFITRPGLYAAFGVSIDPIGGYAPIYAGLVFFGFLYTPISLLLSIVQNIVSRKHEFEADRFSVTTYGHGEAMITALKKLTVDNLSNLMPHPVKVFMDYSHPPVLKRIEAIQNLRPET